jgi:hypothetical protein
VVERNSSMKNAKGKGVNTYFRKGKQKTHLSYLYIGPILGPLG